MITDELVFARPRRVRVGFFVFKRLHIGNSILEMILNTNRLARKAIPKNRKETLWNSCRLIKK